MLLQSLVILILIVLFILTILFLLYKHFHKDLDIQYQKIYHLNHKLFNRGHVYVRDEDGKLLNNCPRGCYDKKCKHGINCYNCASNDPLCCCSDDQCKDC